MAPVSNAERLGVDGAMLGLTAPEPLAGAAEVGIPVVGALEPPAVEVDEAAALLEEPELVPAEPPPPAPLPPPLWACINERESDVQTALRKRNDFESMGVWVEILLLGFATPYPYP